MSIQYTAPGFEPTTCEHELSPMTTRPGLPPSYDFFVVLQHFLLIGRVPVGVGGSVVFNLNFVVAPTFKLQFKPKYTNYLHNRGTAKSF